MVLHRPFEPAQLIRHRDAGSMNRAAEVLKRRPYCHFRRLDVYVGSGSENGMPRYYILYERIPRDGNKLLTVIGSVKAIRSTLKNSPPGRRTKLWSLTWCPARSSLPRMLPGKSAALRRTLPAWLAASRSRLLVRRTRIYYPRRAQCKSRVRPDQGLLNAVSGQIKCYFASSVTRLIRT